MVRTSLDRCGWWLGLLALLSILSCQTTTDDDASTDRLLARVHNKSLYLSELEGMFSPGTTAEDSVTIIETYVNRWVREAVLLAEAERNIPSDLNIDKLVRDYRASLIRTTYEKSLVEAMLDSNIQQSELQAFYEKNKSQYQLETPILRCYFIKVPSPAPKADELRGLWNGGRVRDLKQLREYCDEYAEFALLDDKLWYGLGEVADEMPQGTLTAGNVGSKREFTQQDGHFQYFFRLFELKKRKEIAPLGYIEDQARKFILHQRKMKLMEDVKEDMYERELRRKNIELFTD